MQSITNLRLCLRNLLFVSIIAASFVSVADFAGGEPDKDPQMLKLLQEARDLIDTTNHSAALSKCDAVIRAFETYYGTFTQKVFCARTSRESLGALQKAATDKTNAIVLSSTWPGACFLKGYALQDLHRVAEAKSSIKRALELSPLNSQYLCEMGELYLLEKNWPKAEQMYKEAEVNAPLAPEASKAFDLAHARRGLGYVFVEQGKLDEAEKKYLECLATDPNDKTAKAELRFVRERKAKQKER